MVERYKPNTTDRAGDHHSDGSRLVRPSLTVEQPNGSSTDHDGLDAPGTAGEPTWPSPPSPPPPPSHPPFAFRSAASFDDSLASVTDDESDCLTTESSPGPSDRPIVMRTVGMEGAASGAGGGESGESATTAGGKLTDTAAGVDGVDGAGGANHGHVHHSSSDRSGNNVPTLVDFDGLVAEGSVEIVAGGGVGGGAGSGMQPGGPGRENVENLQLPALRRKRERKISISKETRLKVGGGGGGGLCMYVHVRLLHA